MPFQKAGLWCLWVEGLGFRGLGFIGFRGFGLLGP